MRSPRRPAWCCALACLALAGCGASSPTGPQPVTLSLTAPTSGATVGVQVIDVAGSVVPAQATVSVAGERVRVRHGSFLRAIRLERRTTRIRVTGQSRGFTPTSVETVVHYSARTASALEAARKADTSLSPVPMGSPARAR
jgi:hypothetical protein